jgi:hypothetical protein
MVSLPLSVMEKIHSRREESKFIFRYNGNKWKDNYTRIISKGINQFIAYPEEMLKHLNLNPEDYIIKKRKFSQTITMNGNKIKPFPVLIIQDKNHQKWAEDFLNNAGKRYIELFEFLPHNEFVYEEDSSEDNEGVSTMTDDEVPF